MSDTLADLADLITSHLHDHFPAATLPIQQVLGLAEEAGEFTGAYRRWAGLARRTGTWDQVTAELADVVISAHVTARVLGIDLDAAWHAKARVILTRGWRQDAAGITEAAGDEWACQECGLAFFSTPPEHGLCAACHDLSGAAAGAA